MKLKVQLMRTVTVPTQELAWAAFGNTMKPVTRQECDEVLKTKFGPLVKGIRYFWNFGDLGSLPDKTIVGIEVMNFDVWEADRAQEGMIEADFLNKEEVLRREGALLSELERIGIFLISNENPFGWQVVYGTEGN